VITQNNNKIIFLIFWGMLKTSRVWMIWVVLGMLIGMNACTDKNDEIATVADRIEQSGNPAMFLAGVYQLDKLDLPNGYGEQTPTLTSQYELTVRAVGDSAQLVLSGTGKAGQYDRLPLGTFAISPSASNLNSVSIGNLYVYELRRSSGQKLYITFTRTPLADRTEYRVVFNLYRIGYGLDINRGVVIADESYSIDPTYNERIATLRLTRMSTGVWKAD